MKAQQLPKYSTLENRIDMGEKRWFRPGYLVEASDKEVICPKPRRVSHLLSRNPDFIKAPQQPRRHSAARADTEAGFEILDIFLRKSGPGESPPYFCGSPPRRSHNPLIHDAQFLHPRNNSSPCVISQCNSDESPHGGKPLVRVEGFTFGGTDSCSSVSAQA